MGVLGESEHDAILYGRNDEREAIVQAAAIAWCEDSARRRAVSSAAASGSGKGDKGKGKGTAAPQ